MADVRIGERASGIGYRPEFDGLRAVAILAVIAHHSGLLPGGALGVDVFFVLSGFLITSLLLAEWQERGGIHLRAFYRRRALRLLPALFAMLTVSTCVYVVAFLAGALTVGGLLKALGAVAAGVFYVSNFLKAFEALPALTHLWSLAEEEQFYLLWPLGLLLLLRRSRSARTIGLVLAALAAVSAGDRIVSFLADGSVQRIVSAPDTRADPLLIGCLAAVVAARWPAATRRLSGRAGVAAGWLAAAIIALVIAVFSAGTSSMALPGFVFGLVPLELATAVLLLATLFARRRFSVARLLSTPPLVLVGKVSYGMYLWHWLFTSADGGLAGFGLTVVLTTAMAAVSYRYIERPFLRRKDRPQGEPAAGRRPQPVAVAAHQPAV